MFGLRVDTWLLRFHVNSVRLLSGRPLAIRKEASPKPQESAGEGLGAMPV